MFGKMLNIPFKVLGGVARVVQAQEAKKWTDHAERDATAARATKGMDISVPQDFDPGEMTLTAAAATALLQNGCILDTADTPVIEGGGTGGSWEPGHRMGARGDR